MKIRDAKIRRRSSEMRNKELEIRNEKVKKFFNFLIPYSSFLISYYLILGVINLYPVPIRVLKINLIHAIHAFGDGILCTGPVFIFYIILFEYGDECIYGWNGETEMRILIMLRFGGSA